MLLLTAFVLIAGIQTPSPAAPRDRPADPAKQGTGTVRGRVTSAETGLPLRRAFVTLGGGPPQSAVQAGLPGRMPAWRTIATNEDGRFQFTGLSAGTYRMSVAPGPYRGQYLGVSFGSRRPMDGGQPIELQDGQTFQANVALPRGAALVGRVTDEFGEPVANASVYHLRAMPGGTVQRMGGSFHQTDDLGRFRLFGVEPGEYVVAVEPRGGIGPTADGPSEGFVTTFYPSTYNEREATRVRVRGPGDVGDLEIQVIRTRTFRITGSVVDSQGRSVPPVGAMLVRTPASHGGSSAGMSSEPDGRFTIRDVTPGNYRLVVRPVTGGPPGSSQPARGRPEYASVPLSVAGDIEDLVVVTQPGVSVAGRVVFAEGAPAEPPANLRVVAQAGERSMMFGPGASAAVGANLQFTLDDLFEPQLVRLAGLPNRYALKAVMLGQTDITDTPVEFKPEHSGSLQIVLTSRVSTLEGTVSGDTDDAVSTALVLMFPDDKTSWKINSPRIRMTGGLKPGGKFKLSTVLPGRYYVVAWPRERASFGDAANLEYFETLAKEATAVVIGEDEVRTLDLRVAKDPRER